MKLAIDWMIPSCQPTSCIIRPSQEVAPLQSWLVSGGAMPLGTILSFRFVSFRGGGGSGGSGRMTGSRCATVLASPPPPQCSVNPQLRLIELIELIDSRRTNAFTSPIHTRREDILRGEIFLLPKPHRISHPPYDFVRTTTETFIQPISVSRRVKDLDASSSLCSFCGSSRIRANFLEISMGPF